MCSILFVCCEAQEILPLEEDSMTKKRLKIDVLYLLIDP